MKEEKEKNIIIKKINEFLKNILNIKFVKSNYNLIQKTLILI